MSASSSAPVARVGRAWFARWEARDWAPLVSLLLIAGFFALASESFLRPVTAMQILKQGSVLIASIQTALTDTDVLQLREDVMSQVTRHRSRGIIVDVTALDVMDSFVSRSLRGIAHMTRLRGAETVIVGIQPEVAFAMVQLGMNFEDVQTALDLEEGLALLLTQEGPADGGS